MRLWNQKYSCNASLTKNKIVYIYIRDALVLELQYIQDFSFRILLL